ncbi:15307_t:CDS:2, partial [Funneliformis mosseae]
MSTVVISGIPISLYCFVREMGKPFKVIIGRNNNVSDLKEFIKNANSNNFATIDAYKINLWKLKNPIPGENFEELQKITLENNDNLTLMVETQIIAYYYITPQANLIHVIVEIPVNTGELVIFNLINAQMTLLLIAIFCLVSYSRNSIPVDLGQAAKRQILGRLDIKNILDIVIGYRNLGRLPEFLRDNIEDQEMELEEQKEREKVLEEESSNLIIHPEKKRLAVIKGHKLYARKAYKDLYHIVNSEDFIFKPDEVDEASNLLYCFEGTKLHVGTFRDFSDQLYNNSKIWYLVDSTPPLGIQARTVVSASARSIKSREFKNFIKDLVNIFCMPPWSIEELEICQKEIFPMVPPDLMYDLIDETGGIPRYVLALPASIIQKLKKSENSQSLKNRDYIEIKKMSLKHVEDSLSEVSDISRLVQCFSQNARYVEYSSRLIHRWPDTFYREHRLSWASNRIFDRIVAKLEDERWKNLFLKIQDPNDLSSSRGIMFESHVLHLFKVGGMKFEAKSLQKNKGDQIFYDELNLINNPKIKYIRQVIHLQNCDEDSIIKPTIKNFGAADLFAAPDRIFQITVSQNHPIKHSELVKIIQNMPAFKKNPNARIYFYFIVPDDIYDTFRHQRYITPKKKIGKDLEAFKEIKRKSAILNNVEQWALKIKMTPEMNVTTVINNMVTA